MATTIQVGGVRRRPSAPAQGGGGLTEEQRQDLWDATDKATRAIEQIGEVWEGQDTNSLNSAFEKLLSKINWDREQIYRIDEALRTLKQAQGGISKGALDEIREEMRESINQVYGNVDQQISGGLGHNRQAINALRGEIEALKAQQGGNQGGVTPEAIRDLKERTDKLESMLLGGARVFTGELSFANEDNVKDLSQGERDLIMASLKRAILAPWLATEEVWGKWWVYERASSIKKLATPTHEFKADKSWREGGYRFQAVNGGTLVGNFYTLEQAMASMTHPFGDLRIYVYGSRTPHAIFDPIPEDAYKVQHGHIALLDHGTITLSVVEGDYELIKDTPDDSQF